MNKPAVRICADCRHCTLQRQLLILEVEKCAHPRAVDVVTGKAVWDARQLRTPGSRLCGPGGRLWASKAQADLYDPAKPFGDGKFAGPLNAQAARMSDPIDILTVVEPLAPRRSKA